MKRVKNIILTIVDKYYIVLIWAVSLAVMYLNYNAIAMKNILPYYADMKRIILSGFDPGVSVLKTITYPMWGYGWLFILTGNKILLLFIQNILAVLSLWFFVDRMEHMRVLANVMMRSVKIMLILSLPLYAFHSVLWPYSISISLFLVSFILFYGFTDNGKRISALLASGALFGILLNFRSEFLLLPLVFMGILLLAGRFNKSYVLWCAVIFIMLLPWGMYTKSVCGRFMLTSTNGGIHFFCGLGNMPSNKWGITYNDGDRRAQQLLMKEFGDKYYKNIYLSYEGDRVLKAGFMELVKEDPAEYLKKSLYTLPRIITRGPYIGEFYEKDPYSPLDKRRYKKIRAKLLSGLPFPDVSVLSLRYVMQMLSSTEGIVLYFLSFIVLPFTALHALIKRNVFFMLITSAILYQTLLNMFGGYIRLYVSNMYVFHVINLVFFMSIILKKKGVR